MKYFFTLSVIVAFAMVMPQVVAQSGGLNVKSVNASEKVIVGSESDNSEITDKYMTFAPLTEDQISNLTPKEGMIVYNETTHYFQYWNGTKWMKFVVQVQQDPPCDSVYTDIDGNTFSGVQIGEQCWMDRNLEVTRYPNGDVIPYITNNGDWAALADNDTADAYCYYGNNTNSDYGALYTYAAAIADNWERDNADGQGICPDGWHLPTDAEWKVLEGTVDTQYPVGDPVWENTLGRGSDAGYHLKSTADWNDNTGNGDNSSGFTALPGAYRSDYDGVFYYAGEYGYWWSATEYSSSYAWYRYLYYNDDYVYRSNYNKSYGYSVRCLRDN